MIRLVDILVRQILNVIFHVSIAVMFQEIRILKCVQVPEVRINND
jgi:hypothetical protein